MFSLFPGKQEAGIALGGGAGPPPRSVFPAGARRFRPLCHPSPRHSAHWHVIATSGRRGLHPRSRAGPRGRAGRVPRQQARAGSGRQPPARRALAWAAPQASRLRRSHPPERGWVSETTSLFCPETPNPPLREAAQLLGSPTWKGGLSSWRFTP